VDGEEQHQQSTAHSLHEGVPRSFGGSHEVNFPERRRARSITFVSGYTFSEDPCLWSLC
jgi:hypothetical protein